MPTRIQASCWHISFFCWLSTLTLIDRSVSFLLIPHNPIVRSHHHQRTLLRAVASSPEDGVVVHVVVAMTRESGKNEKLQAGVLERPSLHPVELPCIAHADGPDSKDLKATLQDNDWDYVTITSPEAARVLVSAWNDCTFRNNNNNNPPAVAAVGKATEEALVQAGIAVAFCPSKATAATLVKELPMPESGLSTPPRVLYPASARAQKTLEIGLTERGFAVVRLNTYDTVTAVWTDEEREWADTVKIACFASPSAVKGWSINSNGDHSVLAACIGETSAKACLEQGWSEASIFYPDKPGMEGWVQAVADASTALTCGYQTT
jgi:uroporphyrinogen-III synthase